MKVRGIKMGDAGAGEEEERVFDAIRVSLDCEAAGKKLHTGGLEAKSAVFNDANAGRDGYWTTQRAAEAEEYIRDVVYGGVDGLAYVRSLAEFVSRPQLEVRSLYISYLDAQHLLSPHRTRHQHPSETRGLTRPQGQG